MDQVVSRIWCRNDLISRARYALILVTGADYIDRLLERIMPVVKRLLPVRLLGKKYNRLKHTI